MKKINIEITDRDIEILLLNNLKDSPNKKLITKTIVNHLGTTDMGIECVYKSFLGIDRKFDYKIGQEVWVKLDILPTWRMNLDKMKEEKRIFQEQIRAFITEIVPLNRHCYRIEYEYLDKEDKEVKDQTQISELYINPIEEITINEK